MKAKLFILIFIVILCVPAILPLFRQGFFQSDDGGWMIIRFSAFHQALRDGQLPVRFLGRLNYGYGYPVANFLYPGFMYLGIPIHVLGFGFVDTIKIIFGASMIGSAIFCYLWLSRFFDKLSSFIGSLFYLYTPYHLFDLYKRGSIGEVLALAVLPFILWQIERKSFFWVSISIAFLIISHNTLAVLFLGLIIVYMGLDIYISKDLALRPVIPAKAGIQQSTRFPIRSGITKMLNMSKDKKELLKKYFLIAMLSLGLSAFFWIPAFFELQYTAFSQTQVSDFNSYFANTDLIGFSTIFIIFLTAVFMITSIIKIKKHRLTLLFFIIGLVSILFSSALSTLLWNILPVSFIQFPFRFLSLAIVSISFLAACIVSTSPNKLKIPIAVLSLIILMLSAQPFITPLKFFDKGDAYYSTNEATTTVQDEYMPKWVKQKPIERFKEKVEVVGGIGEVNNVVYNSKKITFNAEAQNDIKVRVNTIYYPGWKVYVDNQSVPISYANERGVMDITIPSGKHLVKASFGETPVTAISNSISLLSFFGLLFIGVKGLHKSPSV